MSMKKIAVISAILENPEETQKEFNAVVAQYKEIVKGRMGLPFDNQDIAIITISIIADMDKINAFTGKLGKIPNVTVKAVVSKKDV